MRNISLDNKLLKEVFSKHKIATMEQLKSELGSNSSMTVFRKLKELNYYSSCSHSGKYYTLKTTPQFDNLGLWFYKSVLFSSYGNLFDTILTLIDKSAIGYTALEIEDLLKIKPNEVLLQLHNKEILLRKKYSGIFVYFSNNKSAQIKQKKARKEYDDNSNLHMLSPNVLMNELKASIILFYCTLNEKQKRLYAGLEAMKLGDNGNKIISELLELNIKTVARGKKELLDDSIKIDTIRNSGGGRKKKKK